MINLENISLVTVDGVDPVAAAKALKYCCKGIQFKEVVLITHENLQVSGVKTIVIPKLNSVNEYSDFVLRLSEYVDCEYMLLVQTDGFVLNPHLWNDEWLQSDYTGAVWPNEPSWIERQQAKNYMQPGFNRVGNGGFSLRSRKFMELSARFATCNGYGEDVFLCGIKYEYMRGYGVQFAPLHLAHQFSYENPLLEYGHNWDDSVELDAGKHFGFHGKQFTNSQQIIDLKNEIQL